MAEGNILKFAHGWQNSGQSRFHRLELLDSLKFFSQHSLDYCLPHLPPLPLKSRALAYRLVPHTKVSVKIVGALYCLLAFPMFMYKIWSVNSEKQHLESRRRGRREKTAFDGSVPTIFVRNCSCNTAVQNTWQTWQGYYLCVLSWSSLNITVFCLYKNTYLKECEISNKITVTLVKQGFRNLSF